MYVEEGTPIYVRVSQVEVKLTGAGIVKAVEATARLGKPESEIGKTYKIRFNRNVPMQTPLKPHSITRQSDNDRVSLKFVLPALRTVAERVREHIPDEYEVADVDEVIGELLAEGVDAKANIDGRLREDKRETYEEHKPEGGE